MFSFSNRHLQSVKMHRIRYTPLNACLKNKKFYKEKMLPIIQIFLNLCLSFAKVLKKETQHKNQQRHLGLQRKGLKELTCCQRVYSLENGHKK